MRMVLRAGRERGRREEGAAFGARLAGDGEATGERGVLGVEAVGRGDVALGGAGGGEDGLGAGEAVDAVVDADGAVRNGDRPLEVVWALGFLEDQDVLEDSDDGLSEQERDDAEAEVPEGRRVELLVRGEGASDGPGAVFGGDGPVAAPPVGDELPLAGLDDPAEVERGGVAEGGAEAAALLEREEDRFITDKAITLLITLKNVWKNAIVNMLREWNNDVSINENKLVSGIVNGKNNIAPSVTNIVFDNAASLEVLLPLILAINAVIVVPILEPITRAIALDNAIDSLDTYNSCTIPINAPED